MSALHKFFSAYNKSSEGTSHSEPGCAIDSAISSFTDTTPSHNEPNTYHIAVQGCCHGELGKIYEACSSHERSSGKKIQLLICCGDFQSVRNYADLSSMAVPDKYKVLGDFHKYCECVSDDGAVLPPLIPAPYLTLFIGGNHENSDWLAEESYGGYLAPNIYYVGHSGVVLIDGKVSVAGLSGIFKGGDFREPYPRARPYAHSEHGKRSAYHVRQIEIEKLRAFAFAMQQYCGTSTIADIVVSHDWPVGVTNYGDVEQLLRYKPYFAEDIRHSALGNPYTMELLQQFRPQYWLSAHLHCHFTADVPLRQADVGLLSDSNADKCSEGSSGTARRTARFLALDKCSKGKGFLDFIDIPISGKASPFHTNVSALQDNEAERIQRHPVWIEVLRQSHAHLQENACARQDRQKPASPPHGFSAELTARHVKLHFPKAENFNDGETKVTFARNTEILLQLIGLAPAVPLQVQMPTCVQRKTDNRAAQRDTLSDSLSRCPKQHSLQSSAQPTLQKERCADLEWSEDLQMS